ncbi:hypothetical protein DYY66_2360 [Candidatus Nitrosotalea sp. FS]|nr:hypothetical protein [Candidatus Nitrosotalea sp. FS]
MHNNMRLFLESQVTSITMPCCHAHASNIIIFIFKTCAQIVHINHTRQFSEELFYFKSILGTTKPRQLIST